MGVQVQEQAPNGSSLQPRLITHLPLPITAVMLTNSLPWAESTCCCEAVSGALWGPVCSRRDEREGQEHMMHESELGIGLCPNKRLTSSRLL